MQSSVTTISGESSSDDSTDGRYAGGVSFLCVRMNENNLIQREFDVRIKSAVCLRKSAMVKTFLEMLAGIPQAPKSTFSSLRDSRKRQKAVFPRCGIPASIKKQFSLVAEIPQTPKSTFFSLRKFREHQKVVFVRCGIPASISENIFRPSTLTKTWCGRKEPHSYVELTLFISMYVHEEIPTKPLLIGDGSMRIAFIRKPFLFSNTISNHS